MIAALTPDAAAVERFRSDLHLLHANDGAPLLVAVSGGPDSLALLLLAHATFGERCRAATVDHGLRQESADEARFVARLCAERGIEHAILAAELPDRIGHTANISARARALRYRLLKDHAEAIGATAIATAHHADDQLETLVMRLNRGAGTGGLSGIRARSGSVIRPLLGWRRAELAAIVAASGIVAVDDPSNRDDRYDRARLRKTLADNALLDPDSVARSAAALREADEALAWATTDLATRHCVLDTEIARLSGAANLPAELRRRLVEHCLRHVDPSLEIRGSALSRLIESLQNGARAMLGDVLCDAGSPPENGTAWHFRKAPPRRTH